eukprot:SAG22_NODE_406_length_10984_cov_28.344970_12_plen_82_part_00
MDIVQIKEIRKSIRQNNFDKKLFLGFVIDYTVSIYKKSSQKNKLKDKINFKMIVTGELPDVSTSIAVNTDGRSILISKKGS